MEADRMMSSLCSHIFYYSASMGIKGGPCHQLDAPASCFVTTYENTYKTMDPFTWPAVGRPKTKTTAPFPQATLMKDLPLAPGTLDCGSFTQYYNSCIPKATSVAWLRGSLHVSSFLQSATSGSQDWQFPNYACSQRYRLCCVESISLVQRKRPFHLCSFARLSLLHGGAFARNSSIKPCFQYSYQ